MILQLLVHTYVYINFFKYTESLITYVHPERDAKVTCVIA